MSAICGVVHRRGGVLPPDALAGMMQRLAVHGPDGRNAWQSGPAALGYLHRQITPEANNERQPVEANDIVLVADLRLDNRDELMAALGVRSADSLTDSALLLRAYRQWGDDCVHHLVGDFAFALWDAHRSRLFCARDQLGIRLLYFHAGTEHLAFATSDRALLELPFVPDAIDEVAVTEYLAGHAPTDWSATFFASIRRLPAAHSLIASRDELTVQRYWAPDLTREIRFRRDDDYVAAYREHLDRAIRDRLRTTHGVAAELSGGLDSSAVVALAAGELTRTNRAPLRTYSNVRSAEDHVTDGDERSLMEAVLAMTPHADPLFITTAGKSLARSMREPTFDHWLPTLPSPYATEALVDATQRGIRVLLSGFGGDHVATSRSTLALDELFLTGRWSTLYGVLRARAGTTGASPYGAFGSVALNVVRRSRWVDPLRRLWRRHRRPVSAATPGAYVANAALMRLARNERIRDAGSRRLREHQWLSVSAPWLELPMERLRVVPDAFQVEVSFPFLDRRLIEYCLAVPCEQHVGTQTRWLVRRAMHQVLPDVVRLRSDKSHPANPAAFEFVTRDRDALAAIFDKLDDEPLVGEFVDLALLRSFLFATLPASAGGSRVRANFNAIGRALNTAMFLAWTANRT